MCGIKADTLKCQRTTVLMLLGLEEPFYHWSCRALLSFLGLSQECCFEVEKLNLWFSQWPLDDVNFLGHTRSLCWRRKRSQALQTPGNGPCPSFEKRGQLMIWTMEGNNWDSCLTTATQLLSQHQLNVVSGTNFCAWKGSRNTSVSVFQVGIVPGPTRGKSVAICAAWLNCEDLRGLYIKYFPPSEFRVLELWLFLLGRTVSLSYPRKFDQDSARKE